MRGLSGDLGASTFWNPKGLSRTVQGLLYQKVFGVGCIHVEHKQCTSVYDSLDLMM
jgi:hypothetical protein